MSGNAPAPGMERRSPGTARGAISSARAALSYAQVLLPQFSSTPGRIRHRERVVGSLDLDETSEFRSALPLLTPRQQGGVEEAKAEDKEQRRQKETEYQRLSNELEQKESFLAKRVQTSVSAFSLKACRLTGCRTAGSRRVRRPSWMTAT